MRKQARRADARPWIESGAKVGIRTYRKRYGVDQYTAYDDLRALGLRLTPGDAQWLVRPDPVPKRREEPDERMLIGDQRMFVVGCTPNGVPYGPVEDIAYD